MHRQLLIITVSVFLLSCAETHSNITTNVEDTNTQKNSPKSVKYTCNRNTKLSVNFTSKKSEDDKKIAIINDFGKQAIILPSKAVASGFLYSNGKYVLRGKGAKATWTVGRMVPFQCSVGNKPPHQEDVK